MKSFRFSPLLVLVIVLFLSARVQAQTPPSVEAQSVELDAADGLVLSGDYYPLPADALPAEGAPAVLLMHEYGSARSVWITFIEPLLQQGYNVLNVDLRGFGRTRGEVNWEAAVSDVQTWIDWLKTQPGVIANQIALLGGSIGADLAIIGCGNDSDCVTAVALSPGKVGCDVINCSLDVRIVGQDAVDFLGGAIADALTNASKIRPVLLVSSRDDPGISDSVRQMVLIARGDFAVRFYPRRYHGTELIGRNPITGESARALILQWLDEYLHSDD